MRNIRKSLNIFGKDTVLFLFLKVSGQWLAERADMERTDTETDGTRGPIMEKALCQAASFVLLRSLEV